MILKRIKSKWLIIPILAIICFFSTLILRNRTEFIENVYSNGIYPLIAGVISNITVFFPFSLDDVFYITLIFSPFVFVMLLLFKKISWKKTGKFVLNIISATYLLFYLLWGFNYFREPALHRLGISETKFSEEEFSDFLKNYISEINSLHCSFSVDNKKTVDSLIEQSYDNLSTALCIKYPIGKRKDKQITFSRFFAKSGITGYFGPFFNEVHVNKLVLPIEYPYVLAHEKSHQMGITSEAEANFYAWLACSYCSSKDIQYAGKLMVLFRFLRQARSLENYKEIVTLISPGVKNDIREISQHWRNLEEKKYSKTASKMNNAYLKTNNIKAGVKDYNGVVKLVLNFSADTVFQKKYDLGCN